MKISIENLQSIKYFCSKVCHMTEYSPAKTGEYLRIFPNFQTASVVKNIWRIKNTTASIWLGLYLFFKAYSFPLQFSESERSLKKTVSFEEQIKSMDKYQRIFLHQMEAILGFHQSCDQNKNRNHSMKKVKNLRYDRWLIYKQPCQESSCCCFSFARYLQKRVTQIYRALYGDAMFVSFWGTQPWRP